MIEDHAHASIIAIYIPGPWKVVKPLNRLRIIVGAEDTMDQSDK